MSLVPHLLRHPLSPAAATWIAICGWLLALALGVALTFRTTYPPPSVARVAAPMLLVVILTAKAVPVQSGLWVLPLLALSAIAWRDHLVWAGAELVHFVTVWLHIGFSSDPGKGLPGDAYSLFITLRMAGWVWVVWQVWATVPPRRRRPLPPRDPVQLPPGSPVTHDRAPGSPDIDRRAPGSPDIDSPAPGSEIQHRTEGVGEGGDPRPGASGHDRFEVTAPGPVSPRS